MRRWAASPAARRSTRPWTLPPAEKCPPAPCRTTQRTSGSDSATPSASMPAAMTCAESVLRVGGSLIVSTSVVPRRSVSSSEGMAGSMTTATKLRSQRAQARQGEIERLVLLGEAEARDLLVEAVDVERGERDRGDADLARQPAAEGVVAQVADGRVVDTLEVRALAGQEAQ